MNRLTVQINSKGLTLKEFLARINRTTDWFYKHSDEDAKDYQFLLLAIRGVEHE